MLDGISFTPLSSNLLRFDVEIGYVDLQISMDDCENSTLVWPSYSQIEFEESSVVFSNNYTTLSMQITFIYGSDTITQTFIINK